MRKEIVSLSKQQVILDSLGRIDEELQWLYDHTDNMPDIDQAVMELERGMARFEAYANSEGEEYE